VAAQTYPAEHREVIVVDNGSSDGSAEHIRRHYPWVRLIEGERTWKFASGNNQALKQARGEFIALLNNDTVVHPGWLQGLVDAMQEDNRAGAVASKILFRRDRTIINSAGLNLYSDGRGGDRGFRQPDRGQFDQPTEVFGASGASMLVRRAMIDDVGFFDERFGMYYEDLDLAWRARRRGWKIRYAPNSVVYHVHCGTSGEWSPFFVYHVERNRVFANLKNAPATLAVRALAVFWARAMRKWLRVISLREPGRLDRQQALAYVASALSLMWHMPGMLRTRMQIRGLRSGVSDRDIARVVTPRP
jgi:GT2 family glycosyltransferase